MPLLKAEYINHNGTKIKFGEGDGLFLNQHDLLNFSWNVQTRGNRIVGVDRKGVREHTLPLVIVAPTREQACNLANDLFAICEADLQANKKGRIIVNGYNLNCFVRGQDYSEWSEPDKCLKISAKVIRDSVWYKMLDTITFNTNSGNLSDEPQISLINVEDIQSAQSSAAQDAEWTGGDKGYYYGYPYNYPATSIEYAFENTEKVPLSWKAVFYGSASNIQFTIAGHLYSVPGVNLGTGDRLEITAKEALDEKTVIKYKANGDVENCFANRNTESYLFEPIPIGTSAIRFQNGLVWQLAPIVERSSPKWL